MQINQKPANKSTSLRRRVSEDKIVIAARAHTEQKYTSKDDGASGMLTTRLEVQWECTWECAVFIEARFSLKMEGNARGTNIGHLYAYFVDTSEKDLFASELLATSGDDKPDIETSLQTIYTKKGNIRAAFKAHRANLTKGRLLYIDTLQLQEKYHGKGLAQLAMSSFHKLLPLLADPYAFSGTVVLCPAASADYKKENDKSDVDIERALIKSYTKSGYEVWLQGAEDVEGSVTVMGCQL